jgi:hypothetical protein
MKHIKHLTTAILLTLLTLPVMAGLGGVPLADSAGVAAAKAASQTRSVIKSAVTSPTSSAYTLHALTLTSGTVVTEYVDSSGIVFAVTWIGPVLPDLTALLGDYFPSVKAQMDQRRAAGLRGGPVQVNTNGLTVVSAGRMGHFSGYAYATSLVPSGIDVATLLKDAP